MTDREKYENSKISNTNSIKDARRASRKAMYMILGFFIIVGLAAVGLVYTAKNLSSNQTSSNNSTENNNSIQSNATDLQLQRNCNKEYTNEFYPDFKFSYDSCEWDLVERIEDNNIELTDGTSLPPLTETTIDLAKKNSTSKLTLSLAFDTRTGSTAYSCTDLDYKVIGTNILRITDTTNNEYDYILVDRVQESNDVFFNDWVESSGFRFNSDKEPTVCFTPSGGRYTSTTFETASYFVVFNAFPDTFSSLVNISAKADSLENLDDGEVEKIIDSIQL
jgi:hypothetical protein